MKIRLDRAAQIRKICAEHNIRTLVHFTRIENLRRILQEGLLSRETLETRGQQFLFNDRERIDGHKEAICLSISFPNYKMFYPIREDNREANEANDSQWVVLLLDANVLWELECAFCQENASSNTVRAIPLEDRKRHEALKGMFVEDFYNPKRNIWISRQDLSIPDNYPTNPQAEVLAFDPVPVQYIKAICFWDSTALEEWQSDNRAAYSQTFSAAPPYFKPRHDWEVWKFADLESDDIPEIKEHPFLFVGVDDIPF